MKAVLIVFNIAHSERIDYVLDTLNLRGYTWFDNVKGRGSETGEPRMGTHTWPEINSAVITIVPDDKVDPLLEKIKAIDAINQEVGIRAFVWDILKSA